MLQVTFRFLQENAPLLLKSLLFIAGPILATGSVLGTFSPFVREAMTAQDPAAFEALSVDLPYIVSIILNLLGTVMALVVVYAYLRLYEAEGPGAFGLDDVWGVTIQFLPRMTATMLFILSVVLFCVVIVLIPCLGALAYLAGTVYFGVIASIALPMRVFEERDVLGALRHSRDLTRGFWWPTFGVLFVAVLAYAFPVMLASTPLFVLFYPAEGGGAEAGGLGLMAAAVIGALASVVCSSVPSLAAAFQYFSLSERRMTRAAAGR